MRTESPEDPPQAPQPKRYPGAEGREIVVVPRSTGPSGDHERYLEFERSTDYRDRVLNVARQGIRAILRQRHDELGKYCIYASSSRIGLIIDWRPDAARPGGVNHAAVVAILPPVDAGGPDERDRNERIETLLMAYLREGLESEGLKLRESSGAVDSVQDASGATVVVAWEGRYYSDTIDGFVFLP